MTEPLARYVRPSLTEARIARQWSDIDARSQPARRGFSRWVGASVAGFAVALAVALVVVGRGRAHGSPDGMEGSLIENGTLTLADGSHVAVSDGGKFRVETLRDDAVVLALESGSVELVVPHTRRTLTVRTPRYDVVDVGTRFRVVLDKDGVEHVEVSEGSVEIRSRADETPPRRLEGGESWSSAPSAPVPVVAAQPAPAESTPSLPAEQAPSPAAAVAARDPGANPRDLLETAERARLAGQPRAACAAFDSLRRRFRSDPRAALAAFELGRLRLDSLGDAHGALEAFDDAIVLAPRGPLRQDAEARRVEALSLEHSPLCGAARDAFLEHYPASAHAAAVAGQCSRD
jgi:transmembrane sensor